MVGTPAANDLTVVLEGNYAGKGATAAAAQLKAVIDVIQGLDDDSDIKAMFNTQMALNKIKEEDETESDKG